MMGFNGFQCQWPQRKETSHRKLAPTKAGPPLRTPNPKTLSWMACFLSWKGQSAASPIISCQIQAVFIR